MYEDYLFIIEVKAGAFTYTHPATDFPAYIDSLKSLVLKPAKQGKRFLEYLKSASTVKLYDKDHNEIGQISHEDFTNKTICTVTLDAFTEMASRSEHLNKIGIDVGDEPIWSISINDLRVYADYSKTLCFFCIMLNNAGEHSNPQQLKQMMNWTTWDYILITTSAQNTLKSSRLNHPCTGMAMC